MNSFFVLSRSVSLSRGCATHGGGDSGFLRPLQLYAGGLRFRKSSNLYSYSHDKYWVVNGEEVCWSTGNWSPSDYPTNHNAVYPPYGDANWWKANRDFTVYTTARPTVAAFVATFNGDWFAPQTYPWEPDYDIICGY